MRVRVRVCTRAYVRAHDARAGGGARFLRACAHVVRGSIPCAAGSPNDKQRLWLRGLTYGVWCGHSGLKPIGVRPARWNLDNPTAPRQPQGLGVRLNQRAYVILCDVPADCFTLFHTVSTSCARCFRIPASEPRGSPDITAQPSASWPQTERRHK